MIIFYALNYGISTGASFYLEILSWKTSTNKNMEYEIERLCVCACMCDAYVRQSTPHYWFR